MPYDGMVLLDAPDSVSAAAVSVTAMSTGAFSGVQTHELLTQDQLESLLSRAGGAASAFTPPGG
jgi:GYD domain